MTNPFHVKYEALAALAESLTGASVRPPCPGVGRRVPYYDVKGLRAACPVCGHDGEVLDDRDGSVFTYATNHYAKEQGR